jgi:hypothetical protein
LAAPSLRWGGVAGVTKILDLFFNRPKIIGEIETYVIGSMYDGAHRLVGAHCMLLIYAVNTRVRPTTIRGFEVTAKTADGQELEGKLYTIPDKFTLSEDAKPYPIDFSKARASDVFSSNLLEYSKGLRGWVRVMFPDIEGDKLQHGASVRTTLIDALGKKHKLAKCITKTGKSIQPMSVPGAGYSVT